MSVVRGHKIIVAQNLTDTLSLIETQSDNQAVLQHFRVTVRRREGSVIDIVKIPSDEPIFAVRSEGSVFLYNLRTKAHLDIAQMIALDY